MVSKFLNRNVISYRVISNVDQNLSHYYQRVITNWKRFKFPNCRTELRLPLDCLSGITIPAALGVMLPPE